MKKIQTKIMLLVMAATLGVSAVNSLQGVKTTRNSTISAIEKTLGETTKLAAMTKSIIFVWIFFILHSIPF